MTHHITAMLDVHPQAAESAETTELGECIAACFECAQTCTACADACLAEGMGADLRRCIRTELDCADICATAGAVLTCQTESNAGISWTIVEACRVACAACAQECEKHSGMHEHCRTCAAACRRYEAACASLLPAGTGTGAGA